MTGDPGFPLSFLAGLASFLSPCVLPLVPPYLAYLGGQAARPATADVPAVAVAAPRTVLLASGVSFVVGVTVVFTAFFYVLRTVLGPVRTSPLLPPVTGAIVIVLALHVAGVLRLPWLMREYRVSKQAPTRSGAVGGFLLGMSFASGWTPCIGATLGAVLSSALVEGASGRGFALVLTYCLGLGVPFVLLAAGIGSARPLVRTLSRHRRKIDLASAGVLVVMGVLLFTNRMLDVTIWMNRVFPDTLFDFAVL